MKKRLSTKLILITIAVLSLLDSMRISATSSAGQQRSAGFAQQRSTELTPKLTAADLVDSIPQTTSIVGAEDLLAELAFIGEQIAADGQHYPPGANLHNSTNNHFLYTYGRSLFAIAQMLPFLPGDVDDTGTTRGAVAAYLRSEVQTYMLDNNYFDQEVSGSIGYRESSQNYRGWAPAVLDGANARDESPWWGPNPSWDWGGTGVAFGQSGITWANGWRGPAEHARWEGLLALWAYAHYTGDWDLIRSNWSTIQTIRNDAPDSPVKPVNPEAPATNAWVLGLTAFARLARGVGQSAAENAAKNDLAAALSARSVEGIGGDKGNNFDYTSLSGIYWIEGWGEWTPDLGRWLRDEFGASQIAAQITDLVTDDRIYLWYESDMSHAHNGENQQQTSLISYPIYQAYTASLANVGTNGEWTYDQAARAFLRDRLPQPVVSRVTPYHRDAYHLQNLVALVRAHGTTTWVAAPSNVTATGGHVPVLDTRSFRVGRNGIPTPPSSMIGTLTEKTNQEIAQAEGQRATTASSLHPSALNPGADNWSQFMHDAQNTGFSRDGLTEGPVNNYEGYAIQNLELLWKVNVGIGTHGRAQPVIVNNVVYQGFLDGQFLALDGDTGNTLWSFQADGPIIGAAAATAELVYFASWDGRIYCRNATTGAQEWTFDTQDTQSNPPVMRGRIKAPLTLIDDTIYVGASNRHFYAINALTGASRWRYAASANIESSAAYADDKVIFMTEVGYDPDLPSGQQVALTGIALNAVDGSLAWKVPVPGERAGASYPVVAGDYVLFIGEPADQSPYGIWITSDWEYFGSNSYVMTYGGADNTLRLAAEMINYYPHHRASLVIDVRTGTERLFNIPGMASSQPIPLGSVYNNWIIPTVYQDKFLFSQYHGLWIADPATGSITHRFDRDIWMDAIRQEEYHQFVGGSDYLIFSGTGGELHLLDLTAPDGDGETLIMPDWGHFPDKWADTPTAPIIYLPGQGNGYVEASGYAIPYHGRLYVAAVPGWFYCFEGTYVKGPPTQAQKTATSYVADNNETIIFTISVLGTGEQTTVVDPLPSELTLLSYDTDCPGTIDDDGTTVTYSGTPPADTVCDIEIETRVNTDQSVAVTNVATVDDGVQNAYDVSTPRPIILNPENNYLPILLKGFTSMSILSPMLEHVWFVGN
jgi:hypothetical protein